MSRTDFKVRCPFCFETIWMEFFQEDGESQEMVVDCEVCCNPILYQVYFNGDSKPRIEANKAQ